MGKEETVILKGSYDLPLNNIGEALLGIQYLVVGPPVQERCGETGQAVLRPAKIAGGFWGVIEGAGLL